MVCRNQRWKTEVACKGSAEVLCHHATAMHNGVTFSESAELSFAVVFCNHDTLAADAGSVPESCAPLPREISSLSRTICGGAKTSQSTPVAGSAVD